MLPGFNHNIKHKGRVFHIQTEDSGPKNPHIITHLFVGGNILASKKTAYAEIVGQQDYEKTVRSMMEEQHKQMLRNLINGVYDTLETGSVHHLDGPAPLNVDPAKVSPTTAMIAGAAAHRGRPADAPPRAFVPAGFTPPAGGVNVTTPSPSAVPAPLSLPPEVAAAQGLDGEEHPVERPAPGPTIFGEDLISEKSLDEVILSYLAEDLADMD